MPTEACHQDVLRKLLSVLKKYPFLEKVGLGLRVDDITYFDREQARAREQSYYKFPLEKNVYFAPVDTTFALYQNLRYYTMLTSARTLGVWQARHLPWYYDYEQLPEDEQFYLGRANQSSTLAFENESYKRMKRSEQ